LIASVSQVGMMCLWNVDSGQLLHTFDLRRGVSRESFHHSNSIAWSPDGRLIAFVSQVGMIYLWDVDSGQLFTTFAKQYASVADLAWSPNGRTIASGFEVTRHGTEDDGIVERKCIRLWDVDSGKVFRTFTVPDAIWAASIAWSPDGRLIAARVNDHSIRLWDVNSRQEFRKFSGHSNWISSIAWSPDGNSIASASEDRTIRLWEIESGRQLGLLESHSDGVLSLTFSSDGHLFASKSADYTVLLWRTDTWEVVATLNEVSSHSLLGLAFSPRYASTLATLGEGGEAIRIWKLDLNMLLGLHSDTSSVRYTNAKVVLVGDSGVGKSGLGLVLTGQAFAATDSTHGRYVWPFDNREVQLDGGREEMRETLLWDLAGQPGYRLVHQLHLNEVAVALIIFDGRSEVDPFAGVYHWDRALRQAQRIQGNSAPPLKKILVAARVDRGGVG